MISCLHFLSLQMLAYFDLQMEHDNAHALVWSITKPRQPGGILHIKIPPLSATPEVPGESMYDPKEIETHVLAQHYTYFSQAEGTIFTQEPLCSLIKNTAPATFLNKFSPEQRQSMNFWSTSTPKTYYNTWNPRFPQPKAAHTPLTLRL